MNTHQFIKTVAEMRKAQRNFDLTAINVRMEQLTEKMKLELEVDKFIEAHHKKRIVVAQTTDDEQAEYGQGGI
jgi:glutaredoxin-related protein